jgi:hypothetical protein
VQEIERLVGVERLTEGRGLKIEGVVASHSQARFFIGDFFSGEILTFVTALADHFHWPDRHNSCSSTVSSAGDESVRWMQGIEWLRRPSPD